MLPLGHALLAMQEFARPFLRVAHHRSGPVTVTVVQNISNKQPSHLYMMITIGNGLQAQGNTPLGNISQGHQILGWVQ